MRAVTSALIVLALVSLSCDVFQRADRPTTTAGRSIDQDAIAQAGEEVGLTASTREPSGPPDSVDVAEIRDAQLAFIESQIVEELRDRHTALAERELHRLAATIVIEAERYDLDPSLVLAVIQVESGGCHLAVSAVGALGLMQLLPSTAEELALELGLPWRGPNSLFDPILNVKLGTAYLSQLSAKYGSVSTALAAYNWGPGRIDRRLRRGGELPRVYIEQVMKFYDAGSKVTLASRS